MYTRERNDVYKYVYYISIYIFFSVQIPSIFEFLNPLQLEQLLEA